MGRQRTDLWQAAAKVGGQLHIHSEPQQPAWTGQVGSTMCCSTTPADSLANCVAAACCRPASTALLHFQRAQRRRCQCHLPGGCRQHMQRSEAAAS